MSKHELLHFPVVDAAPVRTGQKRPADFDHALFFVISVEARRADDRAILGIDGDQGAARSARHRIERIEQVLRALQSLDPPGIGARDVKECMLLQVQALAEQGITDKITIMIDTDRGHHSRDGEGFSESFEAGVRAAASLGVRQLEELVGRTDLLGSFVAEDLVILLMANAGVVAGTADAAPDAGRRFAAYMIQAFCADRASPRRTPCRCPWSGSTRPNPGSSPHMSLTTIDSV